MRLAAALLTAFFAVVPALRADVIVNGGFQTGNLNGFTTFTTANGTSGTGLPNVVSFNTTGNGASYAAHFNVGEQTLTLLQEGGGLSQSIYIGTGGFYTLSEDFASQSAAGYVNGDAGTFSLLINGTVVSSQNLGSFINVSQILRGSLSDTLFLSAGTYVLQTEITRGFLAPGSGITPDEYIDNLALSPAIVATPEPSTAVLLGSALLLAAFHVRRRIA